MDDYGVGQFPFNADSLGAGDFDPKLRMGKANLAKSYRKSAPGKPNVPLLADGIWVDALPQSGDSVPYDLEVTKESPEGIYRNGLQRFATDRHGLDTNIAYCDGHVEKIKLKELWTQRWHKKFDIPQAHF